MVQHHFSEIHPTPQVVYFMWNGFLFVMHLHARIDTSKLFIGCFLSVEFIGGFDSMYSYQQRVTPVFV